MSNMKYILSYVVTKMPVKMSEYKLIRNDSAAAIADQIEDCVYCPAHVDGRNFSLPALERPHTNKLASV